MIINTDCRYFKGEIPCRPHKEHGEHCETCRYYDKIEFKILIIKLDAMGDVLRTTCILHGLKEKYPGSHITWITRKESLPLFSNNDLVDSVIDCSAESFLQIQSEYYNLIVNPDASPTSGMLANIARGEIKVGFGYHEKGFAYPYNKDAQKWFEMGLFDDIKKSNSLTYQQILLNMINIRPSSYEIILKLSDDEKEFAKSFAGKHDIREKKKVIGLNTGAGKRWEHKKWTVDGFSNLISLINKNDPEIKILLYGGREEKERNAYLKSKHPYVIDTGCDNSLRDFIALITVCDLLVTGDTMALHIAAALGKKIVALMGPTSHAEIDLYGRGKKISSNINCLCCYKQTCNVRPTCMEMIRAEDVFKAVQELL